MTKSDAIHLGDLTAGVEFVADAASIKRALDAAEVQMRGKLRLDLTPPKIDLGAQRAEVGKLAQETLQSSKIIIAESRAQLIASKAIEQQAKAASAAQIGASRAEAAEATARAARLREQQAQIALSARLAGQTEREAAQVARAAYQARQAAVDALRLDYAKLRAALDQNTLSEAEFNRGGDKILRTLKLMGERADFTTRELKQLADMEARVGREQNSLAGVLNPVGLSGNVANGIRAALPGILSGLGQITALSPSLGAAAAQITGIRDAVTQVRVAADGAAPRTLAMGQGLNTAGDAAAFLGRGAGIAAAGLGALAVGAAAAGAAANKAVNEYARFEFGLAKISTLTDQTPAQLKNAGDQLSRYSVQYGLTVADLQGAMEEILGAGVRGTEDMAAALQFASVSARAAVASSTDARQAADGLTSVLNAYKLSAQDAGRVSDLLFKTVALGKISFAELSGSIGMVLPQANSLNIPLEQMLGAIALLTQQGISGSQAVEYLRSALSNLQKPSEQAAGIAEKLGLNFSAQAVQSRGLVAVLDDVRRATGGNAEQMARLFGDVGALQAATALTSNGMKEFRNVLDGMGQAAGSTEAAYTKMSGTLQKQNDQIQAKWARLWQKTGEIFAPFKKMFMDDVLQMLNSVEYLLDKFLAARKASTGASDLAVKQDDLRRQEGYAERLRATLADPNASARERAIAQRDIAKVEADIARLRAEVAAGRTAVYGPQQGPQAKATGATTPAAQVTSDTNTGEYQGKVLLQTLKATGVRTADAVVDYCAQWVRLTLGKADAKVAPIINKLFQTDSNKDGQVTANDAARNVRNAGLMRQFSGKADLKPGDVVFYEDAGQGHTGIYIGGGMVRGNNRVSFAATGNPVGNVALERLGAVTGYARADDLAGLRPPAQAQAPAPTTDKDALPSAAQIVRAQTLTAALASAEKALKAKPGDVGLTQGVARATAELEKFSKASEGNKAALAAVQKGMGGAAAATGQYIATQADLNKYGNDALRLIKAQEEAQKSGSAARITTAQRNIDAWAGESKARKAVLDAEGQAYQARKQARDQQAADEKRAATEAKQRAKEQRDSAAKVAQEARTLRVEAAQSALNRLKELNSQELAAYKGTAEGRVALVKKLSQQEYDAAVLVAQANKKKALDESAMGPAQNRTARDQAIRTAYDTAVLKAAGDRAAAVRQAQDPVVQAAKDRAQAVREAEESQAQERRDVEVQLQRDLNGIRLDNLAQKEKDAQATRESEAAQAQETRDVEIGLMNDLAQMRRERLDQEEKDRQATREAEAAQAEYEQQLARENYDVLMELAQKHRAEMTDEAFGTFVAGLAGTVADQVALVQDYIGKVTDPALLGKLKAFLADLRGVLPQYAPYAIPGQQADPPSDGPGYEAIASARDLLGALEGATDPAAIQGYMADIAALLATETGKKLPEATQKALADGVEGAQAYLTALAAITADGIKDGFDRATDAAARPANRFKELSDTLWGMGDALKDPATLQGVNEGLEAARRNGELTNGELRVLQSIVATLSGDTPLEILPSPDDARLEEWNARLTKLTDDLQNGAITQEEFNGQALEGVVGLTRLADAAERSGKADLAGVFRAAAAGLVPLIQSTSTATDLLNTAEQAAVDTATSLADLVKRYTEGAISQDEFNASALSALPSLEKQAKAAERAGNPELAKELRQIAKELRGVGGASLEAALKLEKFNTYADYIAQLGGVFQTLGEAVGGDLGANLNGFGKALQFGADVAKDIASGNYFNAAIKLVSKAIEALGGFKKAHAEAKRLREDFQADNPLLNGEDYQKSFVRSRGFFADVFGGGPEVVNEIDKIGLTFAKTMQEAFGSGIKNGLTEALKVNDFGKFKSTLREQVFGGVAQGLVDAFLKDELLKNIIGPAIKVWSDALKTPDTADDAAALAGIDAAIGMVDAQAERFYSDVAPKLSDLQQKWGIGQDASAPGAANLSPSLPEMNLGLGRVQVTFPDTFLRAVDTWGSVGSALLNSLPIWDQAGRQMLQASDNLLAYTRSGPPALSTTNLLR